VAVAVVIKVLLALEELVAVETVALTATLVLQTQAVVLVGKAQ
jgi:hypothetical protein